MLDDTFKINYKTLPFAVSTEITTDTLLHNHREFEILLFLDGVASVTVGAKTYTAHRGDMIFINPFEVHSVKFLPSVERPARICICFDMDILVNNNAIGRMFEGNSCVMNFIDANDARYPAKELHAIVKAYGDAQKWSDAEIVSHLILIFVYMMKNSFVQIQENPDQNIKFCADVLEYIQNNFDKDITSQNISEALGYTQSYFCRKFRKCFQKNFSEYLIMYRIANARLIIENGDISVTELAEKCGFNSYTYFSKCFKNYIGILPSEYMKQK